MNEVGKCPNDNPIHTIATLAAEIGSSVENMDKLLIYPDYKELASALGEEIIRRVLPDLILSLKPSKGSPSHEIATREGFNILKRDIRNDLESTLEIFLTGLKYEALDAIESWGDDTEEITDNDVSECDSSFDQGPKRDIANV